MSAIQPLCFLIGIDSKKLSKEESILIELDLFTRSNKLKDHYREQHKQYFSVMKFNLKMENAMIENNFLCLIIQDILATDEYDLTGIANYTGTHEDVIQEVLAGRNATPSAVFLRRLIEIHRAVRQELYSKIIKKIAEEYLGVA